MTLPDDELFGKYIKFLKLVKMHVDNIHIRCI